MSKSKDQLHREAAKLRDKLAEAEAVVATLRAKLAKVQAQISGEPVPKTGLDLLWEAALPISRTRSSQLLCRKAWLAIPASQRPTVSAAVSALKAWNQCDEWRKDGNQFAIALDRWIRERRWENVPESRTERDSLARYRTVPKPPPQTSPDEEVTDPIEIARLLSLRVQS